MAFQGEKNMEDLSSNPAKDTEVAVERLNKDSNTRKNEKPPPPLVSWPITDLGYEIYDVIGRGGNAIVNVARCIEINKMCAIKRVNLLPKKDLNSVKREVEIMAKVLHPNLASFYTSFLFDTELWIVLDYYHFGSLDDIMRRDKNFSSTELFSESMIASLMRDVLRGLMYLHHYGFIHCDIKPGNILLRDDGNAVLADFGSARRFNDKSPGLVTTLLFRAPELVSAEFLTSRADIWSIGMTAVNLSGEPAGHMARSPAEIIDLYREFARYSPLYHWVTTSCLIIDPRLRVSVWQQTDHRFFRKPMKKRAIVQIVSEVPHRNLTWKREERPYTDHPYAKHFERSKSRGRPDPRLLQEAFLHSWQLTPVSTPKPNTINSLEDTESGSAENDEEAVTKTPTAEEISADQVGENFVVNKEDEGESGTKISK